MDTHTLYAPQISCPIGCRWQNTIVVVDRLLDSNCAHLLKYCISLPRIPHCIMGSYGYYGWQYPENPRRTCFGYEDHSYECWVGCLSFHLCAYFQLYLYLKIWFPARNNIMKYTSYCSVNWILIWFLLNLFVTSVKQRSGIIKVYWHGKITKFFDIILKMILLIKMPEFFIPVILNLFSWVQIKMQSGAVIKWSNITWYWVHHWGDWSRIYIRYWIHKRHPIFRPNGQAMGYHLWGIWRKLTAL